MNRLLTYLRKTFVLVLVLGMAVSPLAQAASPWDKSQESYQGPLDITVYRDPDCGCCKDWIAHLRRHGFQVKDIESRDVEAVKRKHQLPAKVASCHTALINGYVIEGHVPADDIKRLLKTKPAIAGLAVPQMPKGAPGMEMGNQKDPFVVVAFDKTGKVSSFREYWSY